jgi:hypothetical protein
MSEEQKRKISESLKKSLSSLEVRKKMSDIAKKTLSDPKIRKKYSDVQKKRCEDPGVRKKLSDRLKNRIFTESHRKKLGDAQRGDKNRQWNGGSSFEPYCPKFNKEFKERVRSFFNHTCVECGDPETVRKLSIHHVNFNKESCCDPSIPLFVPLCDHCHGKTNKNRIFWEYWFTEMINRLYGGKCYFTKEEMEVYGKI